MALDILISEKSGKSYIRIGVRRENWNTGNVSMSPEEFNELQANKVDFMVILVGDRTYKAFIKEWMYTYAKLSDCGQFYVMPWTQNSYLVKHVPKEELK